MKNSKDKKRSRNNKLKWLREKQTTRELIHSQTRKKFLE
jgi:hypothetical protein